MWVTGRHSCGRAGRAPSPLDLSDSRLSSVQGLSRHAPMDSGPPVFPRILALATMSKDISCNRLASSCVHLPRGLIRWAGALAEYQMSMRSSAIRLIGGIAAAAMLAVSLSPASAFTLSSPSLAPTVGSAQIDKVWWRGSWGGWRGGGWGWRGGWGYRGPGWGWRGYGWGPAAVLGGVAAGAVVGSAIAANGYYGPCWRQVVGPYGGWHWARVC
jgi:hypothetical protein